MVSPRHVVVSAVNFSEGGPLKILIENLTAAQATLGEEWQITALVHDAALVQLDRVRTIAFPDSKKNWINRLRLEWLEFSALSRELKPDLWLSLHDMTPRVTARRQAVYCHNSSPFYRASLTEARYDPRFFLFNKFYMQLYKAFIRRNYAVIVQQGWMRDAFRRKTGHPNVVVAYPGNPVDEAAPLAAEAVALRRPTTERPLRLLYPSLPRVFKNMELLCRAAEQLAPDARYLIDLRMTLDGSENKWAAALVRRYGNVPSISFIGRQTREDMMAEYDACDAVLFPSRLESWGLPIGEAKMFGKPLLVADLPYAHESAGTYDAVDFLPVDDPRAWADAITAVVEGRWKPQGSRAVPPSEPYVRDWPSLWRYLTNGL